MPSIPVVHVIDGLAREHGGPSYSVPATARAQGRLGVETKLRTVAPEESVQPPSQGFTHIVHPATKGPIATMLRASSDLRRTLEADARQGAILHAHCLWLMPNVYPAWARRRVKTARLIHSIRGMLASDALRISSWKKIPFWNMVQKPALAIADCLHATAESEYAEIRSAGLRNPVAIIPNAVDLPDLESRILRSNGEARTVLFIGRLNPKKGLDRLIRAWSLVEREYPDWRLRIVGPSERGYEHELRAIASQAGAARVDFAPPIYGAAKLAAYRNADIFVLPTLNENFGLTVAEALAAELPVISTKGAPWQGLEANGCGWWVDHGAEALADALRRAMQLDAAQRHAMGARGRDWVAREFSWDKAARDFQKVYRWLESGGPAPPTVVCD